MADPRRATKVHICTVCYKPIFCKGDCQPIGRVVCAECAVRS